MPSFLQGWWQRVACRQNALSPYPIQGVRRPSSYRSAARGSGTARPSASASSIQQAIASSTLRAASTRVSPSRSATGKVRDSREGTRRRLRRTAARSRRRTQSCAFESLTASMNRTSLRTYSADRATRKGIVQVPAEMHGRSYSQSRRPTVESILRHRRGIPVQHRRCPHSKVDSTASDGDQSPCSLAVIRHLCDA